MPSHPGADPGICERDGGGPSPSLSLPFYSPFTLSHPLPLKVGPTKPARGSGERCKLPQWGPGRSPGRKRIWCTLKLSQKAIGGNSFEYSEYHVYSKTIKYFALANMTVRDGVESVAQSGWGRSRLGPPLNPPLTSNALIYALEWLRLCA